VLASLTFSLRDYFQTSIHIITHVGVNIEARVSRLVGYITSVRTLLFAFYRENRWSCFDQILV